MTDRRIVMDGADLVVHDLAPTPPGGATVLAVHGITANGLSWQSVAQALAGRAGLLAIDLRGRGCSRRVGPPYGLSAHADDVIAVLLASGQSRTVLVGHSMGAFVVALAAARRPDLVAGVLLVDGGLAFPLPAQAEQYDIDALLQAVIGPAMNRLSMTFESRDAYQEFWADHPALRSVLAGPRGDQVRGYLDHDLIEGADGRYRSTCVLDAVRADGADTLTDAETHAAPRAVVAAGVPVRLLWAARGLADEPQGLYDPQRLAVLQLPPELAVEAVGDVNHYTVVFDTADLVADRIMDLVSGQPGDTDGGRQ